MGSNPYNIYCSPTTVVSPTRTHVATRTERVGIHLATIVVYLAIVTGVYAYFANQAKEIKTDFYKANIGGFIVSAVFESASLVLLGFKAFLLRRHATVARPLFDRRLNYTGYGVVYSFGAGLVLLLSEIFIHKVAVRVLSVLLWSVIFLPLAAAWDHYWYN